MTLSNESQHESSMCRFVTLVFIATLRRKVLASQCIFQSILDICCHNDATSHEKFTQNIETLKTSMHSSYKSILFFVESCRIIEDRFVRFCTLRVDAWSSCKSHLNKKVCCSNDNHSHLSIRSRIYRIEKACSKALSNEICVLRALARKFQNTHCWESFRTHRWENLHESFRICIVEKASEFVALRKLQNSSLWESFRTRRFERASKLVVERACTKALDQTR